MIAMELREPGPVGATARLHQVQRPDPEPGPGEVLLDVSACAVCRTDLQIVEGDLPPRHSPIVPGHQVVGRVLAHGEGVDAEELPVGRRVGVAWTGGCCDECRYCRGGRENLCHNLVFTGWDRDGGYATVMTARADFVHPLPSGFPDLDAAPLLCGGTIGYRSLHVAGVDLADAAGTRLGLYGFGASATIVIQLAVHAGCEVHVATRSQREQEAALRLGAAWAGGYADPPPVPLDAAITFAPSGDVVVAALSALDRGGIVAINAIHLDRIPQFDYDLLWLERQIRSVANVTRSDVREFLDLAAAIPIRTRTEVFGLDRAEEALIRLKEGRIGGAAVLAML
jgi:propanol-preferring alcohol dehydrogenase